MMKSRRPAHLLALLAALASLAAFVPAAAVASVNWVVHGRGFGHGVGMSAYGAYGYALHGKSYRFILGHYYTGTTVGTFDKPRSVRVLLGTSSGDVGFSGATSACRTKLDPARNYEAHRIGNAVRLRSSGGKLLAKCGARLRAAGNGRITIAGYGGYRGALEAVPQAAAGAQRRQRARRRAVREGRDAERGAALLAYGGAQGAGGRGPLDRPHQRRRWQRLRPLQRHPQPGLQRARKRVRDHQRGGRSRPAARSSSTRDRSPRPSTRPARAARPRARSTSSAPRSPTWSASTIPTTTPARCTPGRSSSAARRSARGSAASSTASSNGW